MYKNREGSKECLKKILQSFLFIAYKCSAGFRSISHLCVQNFSSTDVTSNKKEITKNTTVGHQAIMADQFHP